MQNYLIPKCNGISNNIVQPLLNHISNPQFVFISKQRYLQLIHDIGDVLKSIDYAFIKGDTLSLLAYGKVGVRVFSDIDILIPRDSICVLEKAIISKGYETNLSQLDKRKARIICLSSSHQLMPYRKKIKNLNIEIDLNFELFWGEYTNNNIDISEFLSDVIYVKIYDQFIKTLPPLKAMIQLILHHYKEMNSIYHLTSHDCINYNMFKDVYFLWKNNEQDISLKKLYDISVKYNIIPFVFYILYYTNEIFDDSKLKKYVEAFKTSEGIKLLDCYGLADKERKPWKIEFKTRLETKNLYDFIKDDLTDYDIKKLKRNRRIFG